jgi:hypothetical protein
MPRIRFLEKAAEGFLILATRGAGWESADGTISVPQSLLDSVRDLFDKEGVKYELVVHTAAPLPREREAVP